MKNLTIKLSVAISAITLLCGFTSDEDYIEYMSSGNQYAVACYSNNTLLFKGKTAGEFILNEGVYSFLVKSTNVNFFKKEQFTSFKPVHVNGNCVFKNESFINI